MNKMQEWEDFNKKKTNYPKYPNETMLKVLFGNHLENKIEFLPNMHVLDVGCGFGNNLIPFLELGYECAGTEVTDDMAAQTETILRQKGYETRIKKGFNTALPFNDETFDILLSINVIHYESSEEDIKKAFQEYRRVLKKNGILFLSTTGDNHEIKRKAKLVGNSLYTIQNHDFRDGTTMFFFDNPKYLEKFLNPHFYDIEIGKVGEYFPKLQYEYFIAVCKAK